MTRVKGASSELRPTAIDYNNLIDAAELAAIRLIASNFKVEPDAYGTDIENWKRSYACEFAESHFSPDGKSLLGFFDATLSIKLARKSVVSLKSKYIVFYNITGAPGAGAVKEFIERVGKFSVYPYFRAHFAEVCSQAGLYVPPLPMMKEPVRPIQSLARQPKDS